MVNCLNAPYLPAIGADKDARIMSNDSTASGVLSAVLVEAVGREARREDLPEVEEEAGAGLAGGTEAGTEAGN